MTVNESLGYDIRRRRSSPAATVGSPRRVRQLRRLVPGQRHGERRGRHGVASPGVTSSSRSDAGGQPSRSARMPPRALAPGRTASTVTELTATAGIPPWNRSNVAVYGDVEFNDPRRPVGRHGQRFAISGTSRTSATVRAIPRTQARGARRTDRRVLAAWRREQRVPGFTDPRAAARVQRDDCVHRRAVDGVVPATSAVAVARVRRAAPA